MEDDLSLGRPIIGLLLAVHRLYIGRMWASYYRPYIGFIWALYRPELIAEFAIYA